MNVIRKAYLASSLIFFISVGSPLLMAHGGGLDKYGCHNNRKVGNYHCHRGQFAGRTFMSQAEMLKLMTAR